MGAGLALLYPGALAAWDLAADLSIEGTARLQQVVFPPPAFTDEERSGQESQLRRTQWAQPALAAAALAQLNLLAAAGVRPMCVGGHSFGEVAALHAAGVFDAPTFLDVALRRGELMAAAAQPPGAMTAVRASAGQVRALLELHPEVVLANHNAPDQVVISGPTDAVERFETAPAGRRAAVDASAGRHGLSFAARGGCSRRLRRVFGVDTLRPGRGPRLLQRRSRALSRRIRPRCAGCSRRNSSGRCASSIRSRRCTRAARERSSNSGRGRCSRGSSGRFSPAARTARSISTRGDADAGTAFHRGLARLFAAGHAMDLAPLWEAFEPQPDPRELRRPASAIDICGTNYGKPYPPAGGATTLPPPNAERAVASPGAQPAVRRARGRTGGLAGGVSRTAARDRRGARGLAGGDDPNSPRVPAVCGAILRRAGAGRRVARGGS